jgi:hypothetical protein
MRSWPTTSFSTWPIQTGKPPNEVRIQVLLAHAAAPSADDDGDHRPVHDHRPVDGAAPAGVFEAEARLLVESPQISDDLVDVTVTTSADEEITIISERLLTRSNLLEIADQFDVFENYSELPPDLIVARMRRRHVDRQQPRRRRQRHSSP